MDRVAARQFDGRGPQRVVRHREQDLIAVVDEALHGHRDQLGRTVAGIDVLHADVRDLLELAVLHDGFPCGKQTLGVRVALGVSQVVDHIDDDLVRSVELERLRVADVQLDDVDTVVPHAVGLVEDRSAHVITDAVELLRLVKCSHRSLLPFFWRCMDRFFRLIITKDPIT